LVDSLPSWVRFWMFLHIGEHPPFHFSFSDALPPPNTSTTHLLFTVPAPDLPGAYQQPLLQQNRFRFRSFLAVAPSVYHQRKALLIPDKTSPQPSKSIQWKRRYSSFCAADDLDLDKPVAREPVRRSTSALGDVEPSYIPSICAIDRRNRRSGPFPAALSPVTSSSPTPECFIRISTNSYRISFIRDSLESHRRALSNRPARSWIARHRTFTPRIASIPACSR
jgi:hypothetical protein